MAKSAKQPTDTPLSPLETPLTYETAYAKLETVLVQLEAGDLPLETSLALYEEGARLAKICATQLDEAALRVRQWQPGDETSDFEDWSDERGE